MKSGVSSSCVLPVSGRVSSGWRCIGFMLLFLAFPFTLALPPVVTAEEIEKKPLEERLMIRGGWAHVWGANTTITVPGPGGIIGTSLDYSNTLGGDSTNDAFRVDGQWRFNEKHAAQFAWYRVAFSGQNTLQEQIVVDGTTIGAGASTNSSLSFNMYRAMYQYSFYRNDQVELAFVPGLYLAKTEFHRSRPLAPITTRRHYHCIGVLSDKRESDVAAPPSEFWRTIRFHRNCSHKSVPIFLSQDR